MKVSQRRIEKHILVAAWLAAALLAQCIARAQGADAAKINTVAKQVMDAVSNEDEERFFDELLAIDDPLAAAKAVEILKKKGGRVYNGFRGRTPHPCFVEPLIQLVNTSDASNVVPMVAARLLGKTQDKRATRPILSALERHMTKQPSRISGLPDAELVSGYCWALGDLGDPAAVPALRHVTAYYYSRKPMQNGCVAATRAMVRIGTDEGYKALVEELVNGWVDAACAACLAQKNLKRPDAMRCVDPLIEGLSRLSKAGPTVKPRNGIYSRESRQREIAQALRKMTGQDFGTDAAKWRNWWTTNKPTTQPTVP